MIGDALAGNNKNFENMMNKKIQELNLKNTHFVTPNGLHNPNHYTTAYDLSVISRAALKILGFTNLLIKRKLYSHF